MNNRRQIRIGAVISYIAIFVNIIATLLYTPWMVENIGKANYGLYTLALSFISLFLMDFGIGSAMSRYLSKYRAEGNQIKINDTLSATYKLYFGIDFFILIVLSVVYFFLGNIYVKLTPEELGTFKILFILVSAFSLISFPAMILNGIMLAYEKFIELKSCDMLRKLLTIGLVVLALFINMGIVAVVAANVAAGVVTIVLKVFFLRKELRFGAVFRCVDRKVYKSIFSFSIWTTVISFAQKLIYNIASSVLGIVAGSISIALYAPASSIGSYYYTIAEAINGLFLPIISRKISAHKENEITALMIRVGRFQMFVLGLIFVGFVCVGKQFMVLWMGKEYVMSYYSTILILFPALLEYSQQIGKTTIIAKNLVKWQAIGFSVIGVVSLGMSFLLGKIFGTIGVCASISIAGCLNVLWQCYIFVKKLHIDMKLFYIKCYVPATVPLTGGIAIGMWLTSLVSSNGWFSLLFKGLIVAVIYSLLYAIFAITKTEKKIIINKLRRREL